MISNEKIHGIPCIGSIGMNWFLCFVSLVSRLSYSCIGFMWWSWGWAVSQCVCTWDWYTSRGIQSTSADHQSRNSGTEAELQVLLPSESAMEVVETVSSVSLVEMGSEVKVDYIPGLYQKFFAYSCYVRVIVSLSQAAIQGLHFN